MVNAQDSHALITYYEKKFKERYQTAPVVNRNDARWKFDAILKGMSVKQVRELIDYWFSASSVQRHPLVWFFYNYDKLMIAKMDQDEDNALRAKQLKETKNRVEKWREYRAGGSQ